MGDKEGFLGMLRAAAEARGLGGESEIRDTGTPIQLKEAFATFSQEHTFTPGDLIQFKSGMKNRAFPDYGKPAIFVEYVANPKRGSDEPGGQYYAEVLDSKIGVVLDDTLHLFMCSSKRMEPYTGN